MPVFSLKPLEKSASDYPAAVQRYRSIEQSFVGVGWRILTFIWLPVVRLVLLIFRFGSQRVTIMFVPHSQRKILNLKISMFGFLFAGLLLCGLIIMFVFLSSDFTNVNERFESTSQSLAKSESTVEDLTDEVKELQRAVIGFRHSLEGVLEIVGTEKAISYIEGGIGGNLSPFDGGSPVIAADVRSLSELRSLRTYLEGTVVPLGEIESILKSQKELLIDIPSLWPIKAGKGYVTAQFGPSIHPFTGRWYIHKGIDIAWIRGTEVIATADGKIQRVGYEPYNLGHFVIVKHKYGFVTTYGHLHQKPVVNPGQQIERGMLLGYLGSSGLSTGPHLHYEVRIAEQVVNPRQFLSIVEGLGRGSENR